MKVVRGGKLSAYIKKQNKKLEEFHTSNLTAQLKTLEQKYHIKIWRQ